MTFFATEGISILPNKVPNFGNLASVETRSATSSRPTNFICKKHESALVDASTIAKALIWKTLLKMSP